MDEALKSRSSSFSLQHNLNVNSLPLLHNDESQDDEEGYSHTLIRIHLSLPFCMQLSVNDLATTASAIHTLPGMPTLAIRRAVLC
jgi:hypothetical protein